MVMVHMMMMKEPPSDQLDRDRAQIQQLARRQRDLLKDSRFQIQPALTESVVQFLLNLARMPTSQLQRALNASEDDMFHLRSLEQGMCPFLANNIEWLPSKTDPIPAKLFRSRHDTDSSDATAVIWYEHLSKAGGTSFCKLAQNNMPSNEVPRYYCMPSEGKRADARVGLWSNDKLAQHIAKSSHRIVSNEWNPFDPSKLEFQQTSSPRLVFVTTIRDPLNRLLSAYRFWGIRPNQGKRKVPTFANWLWKKHGQAQRASVPDMGIANHVGRYNFAVWKFSNGTMPLVAPSQQQTNKDEPPPGLLLYNDETPWHEPFELAIRTLCRFDLVIPMESMNEHPEPLQNVLGWKNLEETHVVSLGAIANTDAHSVLPKKHHDVLWDANRFDMILYHWAKAVYLARIHCSHALVN